MSTQYAAEPISFTEAFKTPEKEKWMGAMNKEMSALKSNDAYDLVKLPQGKEPLAVNGCTKGKSSQTDQLKDTKPY